MAVTSSCSAAVAATRSLSTNSSTTAAAAHLGHLERSSPNRQFSDWLSFLFGSNSASEPAPHVPAPAARIVARADSVCWNAGVAVRIRMCSKSAAIRTIRSWTSSAETMEFVDDKHVEAIGVDVCEGERWVPLGIPRNPNCASQASRIYCPLSNSSSSPDGAE